MTMVTADSERSFSKATRNPSRAGRVRVEVPHGPEGAARLVSAMGGTVDTISVGRPTLEDVFFKLTGESWNTEEGA